jgi:hypothetical protein
MDNIGLRIARTRKCPGHCCFNRAKSPAPACYEDSGYGWLFCSTLAHYSDSQTLEKDKGA